MYGAFMDAAMTGPNNMFMEEDRNQRQQHDYGMMQHQQNYSTMMSNSSYQRGVADMKAAGLNPMLAYSQGGASTPPAGSSSTAGGSFQPRPGNFAAGMAHSAQASLAESQRANIDADTDKKRAEEGEIRERTPTHAAGIEKIKQDIQQSIAQIEKIKAETQTTIHSATNIQQQTENLRQQVPQIQATVRHLDAMVQQLRTLTQLQTAQTDQTRAITDETRQRIKQDLPKLTAELQKLEQYARQLTQPQMEQNAAAHDGFIGSLGAILRVLNPLSDYMPRFGNTYNIHK